MYTNLTTNFKIPKYYYCYFYYFYFYSLDKIFFAINLWISITFSPQGRLANIMLLQVTLLTGYAILKIKEHYMSIQLKNCGGNNM